MKSERIGITRRVLFLASLVAGTVLLENNEVSAQEYSSQLRSGAGCYSCGFKTGGQSLPLLSLPASLERQQSLLNRSLGGIAGSSFQTEQATPEQTLRQVLKAPPDPALNTGFAASAEAATPIFTQPQLSAERFTLLRSFEERFGGGRNDDDTEEAFRLFTPDLQNSVQVLGGRRRRGVLQNLFAPVLRY